MTCGRGARLVTAALAAAVASGGCAARPSGTVALFGSRPLQSGRTLSFYTIDRGGDATVSRVLYLAITPKGVPVTVETAPFAAFKRGYDIEFAERQSDLTIYYPDSADFRQRQESSGGYRLRWQPVKQQGGMMDWSAADRLRPRKTSGKEAGLPTASGRRAAT